MKFGGTITIYVLTAAVLCSSFAGAATPCANQDDAPGANIALIQNSPHANHGDAADEPVADTECPCCDDCVVTCVMSGYNLAAAASNSIETDFDESVRYLSLVKFLHDGPVLYPPFRPPIQPA